MAAGGRVDGYVVNMVQGFVVPAGDYPVTIVPATAQQVLTNQLPQNLEAEQQKQQEKVNENFVAKQPIVVPPTLVLNRPAYGIW